MAKRNKDRSTSRPYEGGIRKTESTRRILQAEPRRIDRRDPLDAIGGDWFRPDLSAFEPVNEALAPSLSEPVRARSAPAQAARVVGGGKTLLASSKRPVQRLADAPTKGRAPVKLPDRPKLLKPAADQTKRASPVVTHEVRPARVEKAHATCKERPKDTRPKGQGGSGKGFVPWCDRKRK